MSSSNTQESHHNPANHSSTNNAAGNLTITCLGHSAFLLESAEHKLLVDPFIVGNPSCHISLHEALEWQPDAVLVSHAHGDHWGNALDFALAGATLIATYEIAAYAEAQGAKNTLGLNIGGRYQAAWGSVKLTPAWHSSSFPDGSYGGMPAGFILEFAGQRIYFAGDTGLFSDMKLIGDSGIDLAFLPIGDHFTMGVEDAVQAASWVRPSCVIPMHWGTFEPLLQDPQDFVEQASAAITGLEVKVLRAGEVAEFATAESLSL